MDTGFITLHRKILEWEWYNHAPTKILFFHLLLKANFEDKKWQGISIKKGQRLTSIKHLSSETGLTVRQVRTALKNLETTNEVTRTTTNKYTIITITNYVFYQTNDKQTTNKRQTSDKQKTTNNNVNKDNNDKKDIDKSISQKPKAKRGTRIKDDWKPTEKDINFATKKGFTHDQTEQLAEHFHNHYTQATGKGSTSLNWEAKWRTWVANDIKWNGEPASRNSGSGKGWQSGFGYNQPPSRLAAHTEAIRNVAIRQGLNSDWGRDDPEF
jgi:hypothetical protein